MTAIYIPPAVLIGKDLTDRINAHNDRVTRIWMAKGSNCKPYQSPSTVPAAGQSRVVAAEYGGSSLEVRP